MTPLWSSLLPSCVTDKVRYVRVFLWHTVSGWLAPERFRFTLDGKGVFRSETPGSRRASRGVWVGGPSLEPRTDVPETQEKEEVFQGDDGSVRWSHVSFHLGERFIRFFLPSGKRESFCVCPSLGHEGQDWFCSSL